MLAVALVTHRDEAAAVLVELRTLSLLSLLTLMTLTAAAVVANGALAAQLVQPSLPVTRGVLVQQATAGANNTVVLSGPMSLGLRVAMLRSWRVDEVGVGVAVVALNVLAAYKLWAVTLAVALLGTSGAADGVLGRMVFHAAAAVSVIVLVASTVVWWLLLHHPTPLAWGAARIERAAGPLARRVGRPLTVDLTAAVHQFRARSSALVRGRGARIAALAVCEQLLVLALPVVVVRSFGVGPDVVSTAQVVITFAMVRLAAALTPIPGGLGVTEVGVTALLLRFGAPEPQVLAAVVTFRALTFLLPIVIGGCCVAVWRRSTAAPSTVPHAQAAANTSATAPATSASAVDDHSRAAQSPTKIPVTAGVPSASVRSSHSDTSPTPSP